MSNAKQQAADLLREHESRMQLTICVNSGKNDDENRANAKTVLGKIYQAFENKSTCTFGVDGKACRILSAEIRETRKTVLSQKGISNQRGDFVMYVFLSAPIGANQASILRAVKPCFDSSVLHDRLEAQAKMKERINLPDNNLTNLSFVI